MKKKITKQNGNLEPKEYASLLAQIKADILQTQLTAVSSVSKELTLFYWRIGKTISETMMIEG